MTADDCRLLAEQVWPDRCCFHELKYNGPYGDVIPSLVCKKCGLPYGTWFALPTFQTPSEREELLQWAMEREWWESFGVFVEDKYNSDETVSSFVYWLLSAPDYRYVQLIVDYGKTVLGWTLKPTKI